MIKSFNSSQKNYEGGFTIIELMVATTVFSIVLIGALAGFVQIGRMYYRGIATAKTQEVNRKAIEEISQSIQFTNQSILSPTLTAGPVVAGVGNDNSGTGFFCIGPKRYTYAIDRKMSFDPLSGTKQKRHVLWVDEPNIGCAEASGISAANLNLPNPCSDNSCRNGTELIGENMRISKLQIVNRAPDLWSIDLSLAYGDDEDDGPLVESGGRRICQGSSFVIQFCAISELSTTVSRRVN